MNLQPVKISPHGFTCACNACGRTIGNSNRPHEPRFADIESEPFSAYYCQDCAKRITERKQTP